jgi:hypothetical protein
MARNDHLPVQGAAAAAWGVAGQLLLFVAAIGRLFPVAREALTAHDLGAGGWLLTVATLAVLGYFMGHRGLQRGYAPRVVARAVHLARNPRPVHALLAPLYCMGLVHASRRRRIASAVLVVTMVGLVLLVRGLPQPYRGIVDAGVVLGLLWGAGSVVAFAVRAIAGNPPRAPLDLPTASAVPASPASA